MKNCCIATHSTPSMKFYPDKGKCRSQVLEIRRSKCSRAHEFSGMIHHETAGLEAVAEMPVADCASFDSGLLPFAEQVAQIKDAQSVRVHLCYTRSSRISTSMNLVNPVVVLFKSTVMVFPSSEVPHFSFDLFRPLARSVWKHREFLIWFPRHDRFKFGHVFCSSGVACGVVQK